MRNIILVFIFFAISCNYTKTNSSFANTSIVTTKPLSKELDTIMKSLEIQTMLTKNYDPSYVALSYPNGDVPINTGVCADVVIRTLRAINVDLQKEVHEDMSKNFKQYPNIWHLSNPDKNIDQRRVPNLMKFFERRKKSIKITKNKNDYMLGDIVAWKLNNGLLHIGVVYKEIDNDETPLMVHNIGSGATIENVLFQWEIIGHYRWL